MSHRNGRNSRKAPQYGVKISVISFISVGQKIFPHGVIMSRRKSRTNFAGASNYNFCYFLYFRGTIKTMRMRY